MKQISAGLLIYRRRDSKLEVLLIHPGGPHWAKKDAGFWGIPKGLIEEGEDILEAAKREAEEETGWKIEGEMMPLGMVKQKSGKIVHAWAVEGYFDAATLNSNTFELEWPPKSGQKQKFPEVDRAEYFDMNMAKLKMLPAQAEFLEKLEKLIQ